METSASFEARSAPLPYPTTGKESSESILASSLAGDIARYRLKRRQRYRWAGLLSFEKPMEQDADSVPMGGRQHSNHDNREWIARSCVVLEPAHAEKQHAREPGDLLHVLVNRSRPVREGHKPSGGRARAGEVGLCRTTSEPAEQRGQPSAEVEPLSASMMDGWWGEPETVC
jgi:hypothetical protein